MDCYYDCPCGHAHHEHNWFAGHGGSWCSADDCECWEYHGHRVGGPPHTVVQRGLVEPTGEMAERRTATSL